MKSIFGLLFSFCFFSSAFSQSYNEKIAEIVCHNLDSIGTIDNYDTLKIRIDKLIPSAMFVARKYATNDELQNQFTVEAIWKTHKTVYEKLANSCRVYSTILLTLKTNYFYRESENKLATEHFNNATKLEEAENNDGAIMEYKQAIKLDDKFIYAIDNLAICYKKNGNFKKAIKYYKASLDIFPEGKYALLNIASAYSLINDLKNSKVYYTSYRNIFSNDPEGYFGLAKIAFTESEYKTALQNIFTAHRLYNESGSSLSKDSDLLIGIIHKKLYDLNLNNLFLEMAKEYKIEIKND